LNLLSNEQGTRFVSQPFDTLLNYNPFINKLPKSFSGHFFCNNSYDKEVILSHFKSIVNRETLINTQWKIWHSNFNFISNRCIYKVFYIKNFIEAISSRFDIYPVLLIRHPIPTSLSNIGLGWPCSLDAFIHHIQLLGLSNIQIELINDIYNKGTELERYVLSWYLENRIPLMKLQDKKLLLIKYEDLVLQPELVIPNICDELEIEQVDKILSYVNKPVDTVLTDKKKKQILMRKTSCIVNSWRDKLDHERFEYMQPIFDSIDEWSIYSFF